MTFFRHVLILDDEPVTLFLHLPGRDGLEFLEEFYGLPQARRRNVSLFVLTTSRHPSNRQRAGAFPIDGYLIKPFGQRQGKQPFKRWALPWPPCR